MPGLPPRIYRPRCLVAISCLFDDQVPASPGQFATFTAIPRSCDVRRNSARQADECTVELDYRDFPLDPRLIKDMLISVHIDDVLNDNVPLVPSRLTLRFVGRVDEPSVDLGPSMQTVKLTARDFTGIWLNSKWPLAARPPGAPPNTDAKPTLETPPGMTLGALVDVMARIGVPALGIPPITPLVPVVFTDPLAAALDVHARTGKLSFVTEDDDSAWDVLSALCERFGLVPVFELDILTIRTATFASARSALLIYGQNVESLKFSRNLRLKKQKQVKIVAWNPILGIELDAAYPPIEQLTTQLSEKGTPTTKVEQVIYHVEGPYIGPELGLLAQQVWTETVQSEVVGELETKEMADLLLGDSLLSLANGDILICKLGTEDLASIASMSTSQALAFLIDPTKPGAVDPATALALVKAWQAAQQLSITFYITETAHKWDRTTGYQLTVRFRDFVLGV